MSLINLTLNDIPENIINILTEDGYKITDSKMRILKSYIINKAYYNKLFRNESNTQNTITDFASFNKTYNLLQDKKIENIQGYNFCIKFYNNNNLVDSTFNYRNNKGTDVYIYLVNKTIIKINNTDSFRYIEDRLGKRNIVITKNIDNKIIISYGNFINIPNKKNETLLLLKNIINKEEKHNLLSYNYIKIMFWTSCLVE
jgi:hypothetical protein